MTRPKFIPFDEHAAVRIYQRSLPHWRQDGATYFVTFRLGDSIPFEVTRQWDDERRRWLAARIPGVHSHTSDLAATLARLSAGDQFKYHKHFNRRMQKYLDRGVGECYLSNVQCLSIVRSQLLSGDGGTCHVGDFVIMPNHVHLIVVPAVDQDLENILRRIKGASSRNCNLQLERSGRFWQPESYDHIVRSLEQFLAYREYIATNPRRAGVAVHEEALYHAEWMDDWYNPAP
jgi:putative transposase